MKLDYCGYKKVPMSSIYNMVMVTIVYKLAYVLPHFFSMRTDERIFAIVAKKLVPSYHICYEFLERNLCKVLC